MLIASKSTKVFINTNSTIIVLGPIKVDTAVSFIHCHASCPESSLLAATLARPMSLSSLPCIIATAAILSFSLLPALLTAVCSPHSFQNIPSTVYFTVNSKSGYIISLFMLSSGFLCNSVKAKTVTMADQGEICPHTAQAL